MNILINTIFCLIINLILYASGFNETYRIIQTDHGPVRGKLDYTFLHQMPYYAFRGIPYAQAPISRDLRFKSPKPMPPWTNVKDTFEFGSDCIQKSFALESVFGNEDCLYLNVFVPAISSDEKLSVMIYIHGGAYYLGSGKDQGPDFLLLHNVILVTFNYRLGPYGFLSLGTPEYSGNMGLKDQLAAIQWVNKNIDNFGGNKNSITLFGESAGSSSVEFHILNPLTNGLFQRAILQSGSVNCGWAMHSENNHVNDLYNLGKNFNISLSTVDDIVEFINTVDSDLFLKVGVEPIYTVGSVRKSMKLLWAPVVEGANDAFISTNPQHLLTMKSNRTIDLMLGFCSNELLATCPHEYHNPEFSLQSIELELPWTNCQFGYESKIYQSILAEILQFYLPENNQNVIQYCDMLSDSFMSYSIYQSIKQHVERSSATIITYVFSLNSKLNMFKSGFGKYKVDLPGASHGDDLAYLFLFNRTYFDWTKYYAELAEGSLELNGIKMMTKLWTDFAKNGNPSNGNEFTPASQNELIFTNITNDGLIKGIDAFGERMKFWDGLYDKYCFDQKINKDSASSRNANEEL